MTYFLPINSASLPHYFACACIKPANYFENKPLDIQDRFKNAMLLSTQLGTKDTDCSIELVLTAKEENLLKQCADNFYLLSTPLPISRVKKVYFREELQLNVSLSNVNMSTAFMPQSLAAVATFSSIELDSNHPEDSFVGADYSQETILFDRILGALALMKTAKEPYMNYSENYASTLSFFIKQVREDLERQGRQVTSKFFGLFSRTDSFVKYLPYLEKKITKDDLLKIASDEKQSIERTVSGTIMFDKLSGITYIIAILQAYGVGVDAAKQKIDNLITTNFADITDGKAEGVALYYGYNRGYSVFSNSYGTESSGKQSVKFHLDSQLDYYTIESVYQFVFNALSTSETYPYLDEWCPKKHQRPKRKRDYLILDTVFVGKKKPSVFSREYLQSLLGEVKAIDPENATIASILDRIRIKVASDAKEELEDSFDERISTADEVIADLKKELAAKEAENADLRSQREQRPQETSSLKDESDPRFSEVIELSVSSSDAKTDSEGKKNEIKSRLASEDVPQNTNSSCNDAITKTTSISSSPTKTKSTTSRQKRNSKSTKKENELPFDKND